ncbi:MAG: SoxR reducing system RseC family protein [Dethiobacter sp.]|jgi:sigma-E factor negative regulatory protein RseC|nr:SoxR reducing system RseC family protein [Dethiobacter sp.]MBS3902559.1 SoxR reducing system RseC family protein [Dethiobacter sp.]MCL4464016.1 SoxR reducing system RseC family protein [Bacillota bacterium]MCL5993182.1 SoxR reducing system RseC family protein [Bacillota bacterium]
MEQIGQVVKVNEGTALVLVRRHQVCGKCGGCGIAISGAGENQLEALNQVGAVVGDRVKVVSDTAHVLRASFVAYILPMLALLAGVYAGQVLDQTFALFARLDILLGILFFCASYFLVRAYDKKIAAGQIKASIVAIVPDDELPEDEKC